jgi:ABC-type nitrate/sulfonate/bicarbonate transport system permease component
LVRKAAQLEAGLRRAGRGLARRAAGSLTCCCWAAYLILGIDDRTDLFAVLSTIRPGQIFSVSRCRFRRIWIWFERQHLPHLGVTLIETLLAFATGTLLGLGVGLWLVFAAGVGWRTRISKP